MINRIKTILHFYDYMYYRIATWYMKTEDNGSTLSGGGVTLVSLSQMLIFTDILGVIFLESTQPKQGEALFDKLLPYYIIAIMAILVYNYYRYWNVYAEYHEKWKNENRNAKENNGLIIFLLLVIPLLFLPVLLTLKEYTK